MLICYIFILPSPSFQGVQITCFCGPSQTLLTSMLLEVMAHHFFFLSMKLLFEAFLNLSRIMM